MLLRTKIILATSLMLLLVYGTFSIVYLKETKAVATEASLRVVSDAARLAARQLSFEYTQSANALHITSHLDAIQQVIEQQASNTTQPGSSERQNQKVALGKVFQDVMRANPNFLQLRLIGIADNGREIVRVDRFGSSVVQTMEEGLQSDGDRSFFKDAIAHRWSTPTSDDMDPKDFLASDIDFNQENGKISHPLTLILPVTTPVYLPDGRIFGFLIATIDYRRMLRGAFSDALPNSNIYIAYRDGRNFTVDANGDLKNFSLPEVPKLRPTGIVAAALAQPDQSGSILDPDSVAYFTLVDLPYSQPSSNPIVIVQMPQHDLLAGVYKKAHDNALLLTALCAALLLLAILLTRHLVKPIAALQKAVDRAQTTGEYLRLPRTSAGEIDNVASAFQKLFDSRAEIERKLTLVIENVGVSILTLDDAGTILSANSVSTEIFGCQADALVGANIRVLITSLSGTMHDDTLQKYHYAGGRKSDWHDYVVTAKRANGEEFPIELVVSQITVDQDVVFICLVRDVSSLLAAEKAKSEFISTMSHELRTPLTSVCGALDLLQSGLLDSNSEKRSQVVDIAVKNSGQLRDLINSILDFEKIIAGHMDLKREDLDLEDLVQATTEACRPFADQYGVTFTLAPGTDHAIVSADKVRLTQILTNLLSNAAKFSKAGSTVDVRVLHQTDQGKVSVCIVDQGCGIAADAQSRIFDRFTQVDSSDQRHKGGTGLGLSIAKELAELHGGSLCFQSEVGVGSTFCLELQAVRYLSGSQSERDEQSSPLITRSFVAA